MPIYEEPGRVSREDLEKLAKRNRCKVCGDRLDLFLNADRHLAYLACTDYPRTQHEGIERPPSRYELGGISELSIERRREIVTQEHGENMTTDLDKARLPMSGALTQPQAEHILSLVYPRVPRDEIIRCAILCRDFGLHPLMKEVYIIGFKNKTDGIDYTTVIGISASRKMAADKKGAYSFLDDTPRAATTEEIIKQYGKNSDEERDNLISICMLKGEKGNEATGFGLWPKSKDPYGGDKGNTKRNMANIRSERPAYSRLPGGVLPPIEVIDEAYVEVLDVGKVDKTTGEIVQGAEETKPEDTTPPAPAADLGVCPIHNKPLVAGRGSFPPYCPTRVPGTGRSLGKEVWCKGKPLDDPTKAIAEPAAEATNQPQLKRDPDTIKTINDLYKACNEDFGLQPADVVKELGYTSQSEISDTPADCYRKIAAAKVG